MLAITSNAQPTRVRVGRSAVGRTPTVGRAAHAREGGTEGGKARLRSRASRVVSGGWGLTD